MTSHRSRAFTVVDLTVAIAVLALLILIATPVIAGSRLTSRLVMDLANLWHHAVMKDNYVAANKGRMPNAPPGAGTAAEPVDRPARFIALDGAPHNGWEIPGGIRHDDIHRNYHITFGDYLVEGQGVDMLQDVFISTGAHASIDVAANWEQIRANKDGQYPAAFENTVVPNGYQLLSSEPTFDDSQAWRLNPGYRYTIAGLYGQSQICPEWDFWFPGQCCPCGPAAAQPFHALWTNYRVFGTEAQFQHPSRKVMFYAPLASHGPPVVNYTSAGAVIPIVMVDGSARVSNPREEMPDPRNDPEYRDAIRNGELWAAPQEVTWLGAFSGPGRYAWFAYTMGGPAGYDFRPGTQTAACRWDYSEDDNVNSSDLATLLAGAGRPVRSNDLAQLLSSWGLCNQ